MSNENQKRRRGPVGEPLNTKDAALLRKHLQINEFAVHERTGLSSTAVTRAAAELSIHKATAETIRAFLAASARP